MNEPQPLISTEQEIQNHFSENHLKNVHKGLTKHVENNRKQNFNLYDQNKDVNKQLTSEQKYVNKQLTSEQKNRFERLKKQVLNNDSNIVKVMTYTQLLTNGDSKVSNEIEFERNRNFNLKKKLLELSTEINNKVKISRARNEKIADLSKAHSM